MMDRRKGLAYTQGKLTIEDLAALAAENENVPSISGKHELIENIINQYL